jgi:hypothetical protein
MLPRSLDTAPNSGGVVLRLGSAERHDARSDKLGIEGIGNVLLAFGER